MLERPWVRTGGALVRERLHTQLRRLFHQLRGVGSLLAYEIRELIIILKKKRGKFPVSSHTLQTRLQLVLCG